MATTKKPTSKSHKRLYLAILVAALVVGVGAALAWHASRHNAKTATVTPATSSTPAPSPKVTGTASGQQYAATSNGSSSSSGQLVAPTGQLLNLHTVSLAANPNMESVCITIADASCNIQFTQGSTVKSVGAKSTGSSGNVLFDWTPQGVGLTTGQWTVQAVVTQNGQTGTSASDTLTVNS